MLGFGKIPLEDNYADKVTAYDFLEHIPTVVYFKQDNYTNAFKSIYPRVNLLKEVFRILKPGCIFESSTPSLFENEPVTKEWAQDPTHCSPPWTAETWNYFTGGYGAGVKNHQYGIDFAFEKVLIERRDNHLFVQVRKPK